MKNPLQEYREIQMELRALFDDFTRKHCPTCATPCCRKPARITPNDILLAQNVGWKPMEEEELTVMLTEAAGLMTETLKENRVDTEDPPCDFLEEGGCSFPPDLRPFGCTAWICPIMYREMDHATLAKAKRLIRNLTIVHERLNAQLNRNNRHPSSRGGQSTHSGFRHR